ncbi:hypothetical protein MKK75_27800 [Methylobacterium sp. J-030]|uniref:hypothetical protein n=1 Tax=Methylobacterium sp. J-030 TaxID=2836627 RepID=UPI001FBA23A4|nr:hypothetical protein [Methylobacterium sp. J-030]MCJ2072550.1 hypothetical protein [Methylobacterium sp. J-030]
MYVAIGGAARRGHVAIKDDTTGPAVAFLMDALRAFPFKVTHVLTDRGSCSTADAFEAVYDRRGAQHRKTRSYTSKTNGMIKRFNGRVRRMVVGITLRKTAAKVGGGVACEMIHSAGGVGG